MPEILTAKRPGDKVRFARTGHGEPIIEDDRILVRFEPASGNAVLEKNGSRVVVPRVQFDALNFPGSDDLWTLTSSAEPDENLDTVKRSWASGDLPRALSFLVKYAREMDPAFAGSQTVADLIEKAKEQENACASSLEILRLDVARAKREYDQCVAATSLEYDCKDNLLARLRNLEDQYAARKYQCEKLAPAWRHAAAALQALAAFVS